MHVIYTQHDIHQRQNEREKVHKLMCAVVGDVFYQCVVIILTLEKDIYISM